MYNVIDMYELPLFPLNTVLFPGIPLQLHIFEPRYKLMIRTCMEKDRQFGVVLIHQGTEALGPLADPYRVGCSARIIEVEPLEEGRMNLTAVGDERFRVLKLDNSLPYLLGQVESSPLENHHTLDMLRGHRDLNAQVHRYLKLLARTGDQELDFTGLELPEEPLTLIYLAASLLQLPAAEKQPLLESGTVGSLYREIVRLYRREIAILSRCLKTHHDRSERASWLN